MMVQSEYLENARIHISDDRLVVLFDLGNKQCGLSMDIELLDCLELAQGRVASIIDVEDEGVWWNE